jgi:uncharacterized membrane protein
LATVPAPPPRPHPVHHALLACLLPPFLGALLSDWAYAKTYEPQWHVFAEWLLAGGMVFATVALLSALSGLLRRDGRTGRALASLLALVATFAAGGLASLLHARDVWATMPMGFVMTVLAFLLALVAIWAGVSTPRREVVP